ncbi:MAG: hypothetical protein A2293_07825 [Elusimicrobia bacterium RIFOXYB2_FULL_49_7]|nr:MAG: hypothetical protein A2293_07825 [Elusimicrobia bacterium RIFOXYB2_FULL_49_7]
MISKRTLKIAVNVVGVKESFAGIGNCALHLFNELAQLTPDVQYYVYLSGGMQRHYQYSAPNIKTIPITIPFNSTLLRIVWDQLMFPFSLRKYNLLFSIINVACLFSIIPQITFIYDLAEKHMPERFSFLKRVYLEYTHAITLRKSRAVLTISDSTKADLLSLFPKIISKVTVIPLGYKKLNTVRKQEVEILQKHQIKAYFFCVATFEPGKNHIRLLEAFKRFVAMNNKADFSLILAGGKGWYFEEVMQRVRELELEQQVVYTGFVTNEELGYLMEHCTGFVFPSLYEGFGLPVLEAMQFYVPILTSNTSSLPEVGGAGVVYCDPRSADSIYDGLLELLRVDRRSLQLPYDEQMRKYTWQNGARAVLSILKSALNENCFKSI